MDKSMKMNMRERHIVGGTVVSDESWACLIEAEGEEWIAHNVGGDKVFPPSGDMDEGDASNMEVD